MTREVEHNIKSEKLNRQDLKEETLYEM